MGRLVVVMTSPRVPAGLLTRQAWSVIESADLVAASDDSAALPNAVAAQDIVVESVPDSSAAGLLARATAADVVWLAGDDGDERLLRELADDVVRRCQSGRPGPELEILVGSFDPPGSRLLDLVAVMDRLRVECPWDQQQTHESLVRYLTEEAYETVEAIETGDAAHLRDELGDLLLQVMFHARIASDAETDRFDIDDVAAAIVAKLIRRHPHVFADVEVAGAAEVEANWEAIKAEEKAQEEGPENAARSSMDGLPPGLPALSLAVEVVGRALAAKTGLSVPTPAESGYTAETLGEVLFALSAASHAAGIDPEQALRQRVRREIAEVAAAEQRALQADAAPPG